MEFGNRSLKLNSIPFLPSEFYQSIMCIKQLLKEIERNIRNIVTKVVCNDRFLKGRVDRSLVECLIGDRKRIGYFLLKKVRVILKSYHSDLCRNSYDSEALLIFVKHDNRRYDSIIEDMVRLLSKVDTFLSRISNFSKQTYVLSSDFEYTINKLQESVYDLRCDLEEFMKKSNGYVVSKIFPPSTREDDKNKSGDSLPRIVNLPIQHREDKTKKSIKRRTKRRIRRRRLSINGKQHLPFVKNTVASWRKASQLEKKKRKKKKVKLNISFSSLVTETNGMSRNQMLLTVQNRLLPNFKTVSVESKKIGFVGTRKKKRRPSLPSIFMRRDGLGFNGVNRGRSLSLL